MSTTDASTTTSTSDGVTLPAGATAGAAYETSQTNAQGQVVSGVIVPVVLQSGAKTTVFIPYSVWGNVAQMQALFDARLNPFSLIPGQ